VRRRWVALLFLATCCAVAPCPAAEPDGALVLRTAWIEGTSRILVTIDPRVEVREASLVPSAPRESDLRLAVGEEVLSLDGGLPLGTLRPGAAVVLEFQVRRDLPTRVIASCRVEGRTADGRPVSEAVGHAVSPGPAPRVRDGAAEYPGRVVPPGSR